MTKYTFTIEVSEEADNIQKAWRQVEKRIEEYGFGYTTFFKGATEGVNKHRFKDNPMEKAFLDTWRKYNMTRSLEHLLSNDNKSVIVCDRDIMVAETLIQWLGSPVGLSFLKEVIEN